MDRAVTFCGVIVSRGMAAVVVVTFGTMVLYGIVSGVLGGWGSLIVCRGRVGVIGRGVVAAASGRFGRMIVGEKY